MNAKKIVVFVVCLIIAFLMWVVHQLNQTYIKQYNFHVIITQVPAAYEKDSIYLSLKIEVKGSGSKILLLENYYPEAIYVPFKKLKRINKNGMFYIDPHAISDNGQFPVKIKVQKIIPDTITIHLKDKHKNHHKK